MEKFAQWPVCLHNQLSKFINSFLNPTSQFHNHAQKRNILASHWTVQLGRQDGRLLHWPQCSCVSMKTKLWKLLLWPVVCMPSLIVQWPARMFTFSYCAWLWNWLFASFWNVQSSNNLKRCIDRIYFCYIPGVIIDFKNVLLFFFLDFSKYFSLYPN